VADARRDKHADFTKTLLSYYSQFTLSAMLRQPADWR